MSVNIDKSIGKPFLKSANPLSKKWIICIKYKNSQNEHKEYKRTFDLNKAPFVIKGVVNTKANIVKQRQKRASQFINELINDLNSIEFDVNAGDFVQSILDKPLKEFINDWLLWKKNKVKASSFKRYSEKISVFNDWLYTNQLHNISLKRFDYLTLNRFLNFIQTKSSNISYNFYLTVFKNIYKYLTKIEDIQISNITTRFEKLKENDTEKHALYSDYQQAFNDLTEFNYLLGYMAKCIFYTLHRIETLTSLQYKDFDLSRGIINIPSAKIKTAKKLTIRISKHLLPQIIEYVNEHRPQPNDYFFGNHGMIKSKINLNKTDVRMFGKHKTSVKIFSQMFAYFKNKKTTNKELFTAKHSLYGMKANGYSYYKNGGDGQQFILSDEQIIKITGHSNTDILKKYSREYEAIISEELWNSL
ncbi:site-specific integrase [Sphingobacterium endophyticum]|uniref:site-specific integrase n=1 Tax=Sphingobacterium endophyticum TaxID=2546448 RepID=UPI0012E174A7|nr:site-specific integrase [Sphingobacterium endophyticum]